MRLADEIQELFEEAMREVDRLSLNAVRAAAFGVGHWLAGLWPRMPCEGWQDELDWLLREYARNHLFITDQSRADIIAWVTAANEEAKRDALVPGSAGPRLVDICYGPRPQPAALRTAHDKPAPLDPDYPALRRVGHIIMEQFPPADWLSLAAGRLKRDPVPEEIAQQFLAWIEAEQRSALGANFPLPPGTPVGSDGKLYEVCVAAGTPITTKRGKVAVELVTKSDELLVAAQRNPGGPLGWKPVTEIYHNKPAELMSVRRRDGEVLRVTPGHKLYVHDKGWVAAAELKPGDLLRTDDDRYVPVTEIFRNGEVEPVFNLCVEGYHTYFAGGVLVHNESPAGDGGPPFDRVGGVVIRGAGGPVPGTDIQVAVLGDVILREKRPDGTPGKERGDMIALDATTKAGDPAGLHWIQFFKQTEYDKDGKVINRGTYAGDTYHQDGIWHIDAPLPANEGDKPDPKSIYYDYPPRP